MQTTVKRWLKPALLLPVVIYLLLNGFHGYKDIDKRFFVVSVGIDQGEKKDHYKITLKLSIPSPDPRSGESSFILVSQEEESIAKAVRLMKSTVDKELDFAHAKTIIFGYPLVQERDMMKVIDWFERRRDIQKIAWVSVGYPTAEKVLAIKPKQERFPSNDLFLSFGNTGSESPYITSTYFFGFRRMLYDRGIDAYLPISEKNEKEKEPLIKMNRLYILSGNKGGLILEPQQTKFFNMLKRGPAKFNLEIDHGGQHYWVNFDHISVKCDVHKTSANHVQLEINGKVKGSLEESESIAGPEEYRHYEELAKKQVEDEIIKVIEALQKNKVDPLGFGVRYRVKYQDFDPVKWMDMYPKAEIRVNIGVRITGTGLVK